MTMDQPKQTKEKVREYIRRRQIERRQPPHGQAQIRTEIGWNPVERSGKDRRGN